MSDTYIRQLSSRRRGQLGCAQVPNRYNRGENETPFCHLGEEHGKRCPEQDGYLDLIAIESAASMLFVRNPTHLERLGPYPDFLAVLSDGQLQVGRIEFFDRIKVQP